jgi:hypothetical protein
MVCQEKKISNKTIKGYGSAASVPIELAVTDPLVTPVELLLNDLNIIWYLNRVVHQYV